MSSVARIRKSVIKTEGPDAKDCAPVPRPEGTSSTIHNANVDAAAKHREKATRAKSMPSRVSSKHVSRHTSLQRAYMIACTTNNVTVHPDPMVLESLESNLLTVDMMLYEEDDFDAGETERKKAGTNVGHKIRVTTLNHNSRLTTRDSLLSSLLVMLQLTHFSPLNPPRSGSPPHELEGCEERTRGDMHLLRGAPGSEQSDEKDRVGNVRPSPFCFGWRSHVPHQSEAEKHQGQVQGAHEGRQ